ncbi:uncharacterized protein BCR38DRAFT_354184 [Pseudomassariella vexata]|uniref:G-protein coupled receptors family 1 profile domain-containing protein n=1 Tax=Pseudomassariella vexata TaxID=1141098 RepID=A0A1Y2DEQ1_9PEZI|nr:uncharacterized protein BCR38DRAFT_354184 [Pseudomassariella vexata]ORY57719.1 hypothetical protein BCR38DRAFT_354184 [Pseudomassariella vexata]
MGATPWEPAVAIPTLVATSLSAMATGFVIVLWLLSKGEKNSLRYSLVLNLTFAEGQCPVLTQVAEFINAANNLVSGTYVVATKHDLEWGPSCDANGWIGQVSVQAADFSVLVIAVVTLLTMNFQSWVMRASFKHNVAICLSTWIVPLCTGSIALAIGKIAPVSGNWCWISEHPGNLRYILTHGWRFGSFIIILIIYIFMFCRVYSHVRRRKRLNGSRIYTLDLESDSVVDINLGAVVNKDKVDQELTSPPTPREAAPSQGEQPWQGNLPYGFRLAELSNTEHLTRPKRTASLSRDFSLDDHPPRSTKSLERPRSRSRVQQASALDNEMRHWLLLSIYPLTYILVWIPGIANRLVEMTGGSSHVLEIMQATTQLTGLVNALAYGIREHRQTLKRWRRLRVDEMR